MSSPVYSKQFFRESGVTGTSSSVVVPEGHVYIVRFVAIYCNAPAGPTTVFFEDDESGGALLWASSDEANPIHVAQDCRFVFEADQGFHFQVNNTVGFDNSADCFAAGYDLTAP